MDTWLSWRRARLIAAWAVTGAMAALLLTQVLRIGQPFPLPIIQSLTPYLLLPALPLAAWWNWRRRWVLAFTNAAIGLGLLGLLTPAVLAARPPRPSAGAVSVSLLGSNVLFNNLTPAAAARVLVASGADVLGLTEYDPDMDRELATAGVDAVYPFQAVREVNGSEGLAVYSKYPIVSDREVHPGSRPALDVVLDIRGHRLRILVAHPLPPVFEEWRDNWSGDLGALGRLAAEGTDPMVMLGDLNSSRWHPDFRRLLATGHLRDAHDWMGEGLLATWPADRAVPPFVRLDHVLVGRGVIPTDVGSRRVPGSDHVAVTATVAVP